MTFHDTADAAPTTPDADHEAIALAPTLALRAIARRFGPYTRGLRRWIALSLFLVVLVPAIETLKIWMFKVLIDDVLVPKDFTPFAWVVGGFLVLTIVGGAVSAIDDTLSTWIGQRFVLAIRRDLFAHCHRISVIRLGRRKTGDLVSRVNGDVSAIEGFVVGGLTDLVAFAAEVVFFAAALFYISWDLALVALIAVPGFWITARHFSGLIHAASRERRRRSGTISALTEESLSHAALVQAYDRQDSEVERFDREGRANMAAAMRSTRLQAVFAPTIELIEVLGALVVIGYGTWKLTNGQLTIGALLVFLTYLTQLYDPIRGLSKLATSLYSAAAGAERVVEILDEPVAVETRPDAFRPAAVAGELTFAGVTFRYSDDRQPALDDVSFTVPPAGMTVLAGPNGAGKSTIARLALRLHDPDRGTVRLDGNDLRDLDLSWLRGQIAIVMQDGGLWDSSIRENLLFGAPDATEAEIVAAARRAGVHDFVRELPQGYDTVVGPRGSRLSGGQRQRIAIARALLRDAPIVILDEPTNHIDRVAATVVRRAIRELAGGRTVIVISHDPALIAQADHVVPFADGRVGPPDDVITPVAVAS